jgi:hypothetical protein
MVRTLITIVLSCTLGVGGTLLSQRVLLHTQGAVVCPKAPPEGPGPHSDALRPMDTTYEPQGRLLPMPSLHKE